jgi:hypothetical protein
MTLAGGHGGSSERESYVSMIIRSTANSVPHSHINGANIEQVDLVPTLSTLLNLGIPTKNVGILMDEYFLTDENEIAKNTEVNAQQLYLLALENRGLFSDEALGNKI